MWPAALITAGASAFGLLFSAGILPSAILITVIWLVLRANAFSHNVNGLHFADLLPKDFSITAGGLLLLFILLVVAVTAVLQGFHFGIVRILEGYWGGSRLASVFIRASTGRHRNRLHKAKAAIEEALDKDSTRTDVSVTLALQRLQEQAADRRSNLHRRLQIQRARQILASYPPDENDLLPTRFGNVMRSGERRAGERYGWHTIPTWPRLYLGLSESTATAYRSTADGVYTAAVFCMTFLVITLFTIAAFYDDRGLWWFCAVAAVLTYVSYRGAVASAVTLGVIQAVAFDRHRFDLLESMHVPLPDTPREEFALAERLSRFLAEGGDIPTNAKIYLDGIRYSHAPLERRRWRWRRDRGKDQ